MLSRLTNNSGIVSKYLLPLVSRSVGRSSSHQATASALSLEGSEILTPPSNIPKQTSLPLSSNKQHFIETPDHFKFLSKFSSYAHHGASRTPVVNSLMDLTDSTSSLSLLPRRRLYGNPYETLSIKSGDDAMIVSPNLIGVADGVSGWEKVHGNSGLFARSFLENISRNFTELTYRNTEDLRMINEKDLNNNLDLSYEETLKIMKKEDFNGSSTLVLGMIIDKMLKIISIGDSKIFVLRSGEIVEASQEQYIANLCPQQVGTQEQGKSPSKVVQYQDFELEQDDLILVCSDGVTDNLYPDEILEVINNKINVEKTNLQEVCNTLLIKVKQTAFDNYCVTPYVEKVNELSSSFIQGGKLDDISICLSKVLLNKSEKTE